MRFSKHSRFYFLPFFIFFILSGETLSWAAERQSAVVLEALTGDSVRLKGGKILKYIGVQSPPLQSLIPLVRQYGSDALKFNRDLVEGKGISIEWDNQLRDSHGNLLGYVFLENGTFVNDSILKAGHGKWIFLPPNLKYSARFQQLELEARRDKKGLWIKEPDNPYLKSGCLGEKNSRIYHFPTCEKLSEIPESYLVPFDSRIAAKAANYKPCAFCRNAVNEEEVF